MTRCSPVLLVVLVDSARQYDLGRSRRNARYSSAYRSGCAMHHQLGGLLGRGPGAVLMNRRTYTLALSTRESFLSSKRSE
ncbi:uncharacterized protein BT62DRAFT_694490 [Guyanagaster necrorhizus]|uniref:Uncharacterized protein n=1 Tax=Guyanagaster necrorhizus TaxID=856835 RepID=A0A9P7VEX7_9AGAR|nr:uncharacterized protein BT62DRAFT_694490 [Guyanagaster necrorhizus MCA 3950]KAG7439678.1 hypothetical protein BT62DRAFT_694490 [Guyanagaster necrorhizus MCA 3950]